jgi:hypothetical protein
MKIVKKNVSKPVNIATLRVGVIFRQEDSSNLYVTISGVDDNEYTMSGWTPVLCLEGSAIRYVKGIVVVPVTSAELHVEY